jgi:triphosphoribosyl-dephospho-CoA synthase
MPNEFSTLQLRDWLVQACLAEVLSEKPGNVSPSHPFGSITVEDFCCSAQAASPILAKATPTTVGRTIYEAARATREAVGHNTNLGILLLLAPMAAVPASVTLSAGLPTVLSGLTVQDADWTYRAIRVAAPGGLGKAEVQDVHDRPTKTLLQCMRYAATHDLIALQYSSDFRDVLTVGLDWLTDSPRHAEGPHRIGWLALKLLSQYGDSLIVRKSGKRTADRVQRQATEVLTAGWPGKKGTNRLYAEFDAYLRSDGNRLNPGTTADMIAAIIFAGLRSGRYSVDAALLHQINSQESP